MDFNLCNTCIQGICCLRSSRFSKNELIEFADNHGFNIQVINPLQSQMSISNDVVIACSYYAVEGPVDE